jgi:blue copper oxidase
MTPRLLRAHARAPIEGNRLRISREWEGGELAAAVTQAEVWPGETTELWTLGGSWPAPTIRVRRGQVLDVPFVNHLSEPTTIHWHGLIVPPEMDGHPSDAVVPGGTFRYVFEVENLAGTYWYHPHPHERTAAQVYKGMAGLIIVEDDEEQAFDLPRGVYDLPLVIQDRYLDGARAFEYAPTSTQMLNGLLGDTAFVNGTPDAYHEVDAGLYRLRVVNGANARIMKLGFADGRRFSIIGTDGGLIDRPREVTETLLAPAERVELLVDFADLGAGEECALMSLAYGTATTAQQQGFALRLLRFVGTGTAGHTRPAPTRLRTLPAVDPLLATEYAFEFDTSPIPRQGHNHWINGKVFEMDTFERPTIALNGKQRWDLRNMHTMPHPIHIHGTQFRIAERNGAPVVDPRDMGWKDTIQLDGLESARVDVQFSYWGIYLIHCHNLEHEDDGMMLNFFVQALTGVDEASELPTELDLR